MPATDRPRSSSPYAVEDLAVKLQRSTLGACWRWRSELSVVVTVLGLFFCGWWRLGSWLWPLLIFTATGLVLAVVPWWRRSVAAWYWTLFTRHRLQRAFWELRLHTRAGRLPLIVRSVTTAVGTQAWVLLRAGMTFEDFEDSAAAFAAACGAREARVTCSARWSWLVSIDVIRRDVLGPARTVCSPLAALPPLDSGPVAALPAPARAED